MIDSALSPEENLRYQLETLASYEPKDLDNPEFDVAYEHEGGSEHFAAVCCIDVASRALERIKELELAIVRHKGDAGAVWTHPVTDNINNRLWSKIDWAAK